MAGRPRKFDRSRALDQAMEAFWRQGYSNVSVSSLCEEMGITRSSFYNTFESIDALHAETIDHYARQRSSYQLRPQQSDNPTPVQGIAAVRCSFRLLCRILAEDPSHKGCLIMNSLVELEHMPAESRIKIQVQFAQSVRMLRRQIAKAIELGELNDQHLSQEELALALQTLAAGLSLMSKTCQDEGTLWRIAEATLFGLGFCTQA